MTKDGYVQAATPRQLIALDDLPDGAVRAADGAVDGIAEPLIVVREGGTVRAFLNVCPHAGRRLDWSPGNFLIDQGRLVCAAHGACFERMSGHCVAGPCRGDALREVAVEQADGWVVLAAPPAGSGTP